MSPLLTDPLSLGYDVPVPTLADLHACRDGRAEPICRSVVPTYRPEPAPRPKRVRAKVVPVSQAAKAALPPPTPPRPPHSTPEPDWDAPEVEASGKFRSGMPKWSDAKGRWMPSSIPPMGCRSKARPWRCSEEKRAETLASVAGWFDKHTRPGVTFTYGSVARKEGVN